MIAGFQHLAMCRFVRKKKKKKTAELSSKVGVTFLHFHQKQSYFGSAFLLAYGICVILCVCVCVCVFNFSHLIGVKCYPIVVSISNSLITNALYILIDRTPKHTLVEYQKNNKRVFKGVCTNVHSYYQCKKNIDIEVLSHRKLSNLANVVVNK